MATSSREQVRLAELIAAISLATDLGTGQPTGHALRTCYLATGSLAGSEFRSRTSSTPTT